MGEDAAYTCIARYTVIRLRVQEYCMGLTICQPSVHLGTQLERDLGTSEYLCSEPNCLRAMRDQVQAKAHWFLAGLELHSRKS